MNQPRGEADDDQADQRDAAERAAAICLRLITQERMIQAKAVAPGDGEQLRGRAGAGLPGEQAPPRIAASKAIAAQRIKPSRSRSR